MCSSSEAGSYSRLIDVGYHSTLGLRVIKKKKKGNLGVAGIEDLPPPTHWGVLSRSVWWVA